MALNKITKKNFNDHKPYIPVSSWWYNELVDYVNNMSDTEGTLLFDPVADVTDASIIKIDADIDVNNATNRFDAIDINLDDGIALAATEIINGLRVTVDGLAADADASLLMGVAVDVTSPTTSRANTCGLYIKIDSVRTTADSDRGIIVSFDGTMNNANADIEGIWISSDSLTHTNGTYYGVYNYISHETVAGTTTAEYVTLVATGFDEPNYGIIVTKTLVNSTAVGTLAQTNNALRITENTATSAAASGASTSSNDVVYFSKTASTAVASADVYGGVLCNMINTIQTTGTGTATATETTLKLDYNVSETAGTLTLDDFNVMVIDYDTAGTPSFGAGTYNLLLIEADDAAIPVYAATTVFNGLKVDFSGLNMSDADFEVNGINSFLPALATSPMRAIYAASNDGNITVTLVDGVDALIVRGRVRDAVGVGDEKSEAYFNVKTLYYTIGDPSDATCDYQFAADEDKGQQSIQLGAGAVIPAFSRVLDVIIKCTEDFTGSAGDETDMNISAGTAAANADYVAEGNCEDADEVLASANNGAFEVAVSAAAASVYINATPTVNDWDELTAGMLAIYITYVDNSNVA